MKKRIFITATNTGIGKTYTTLKLMHTFTEMGLRVGVVKPVETGVKDGKYPDGDLLLATLKKLNPACSDLSVEDVVPLSYELPAAPYVASGGAMFDFTKVTNALDKMDALCDILLIEGAGGVMVPVDYSFMMIDLIDFFRANALLVTHCSLGCINDTLLSFQALQDKNIATVVAFNCREDEEDFTLRSEPYFLKKKFDVLRVESDIEAIAKEILNSFMPPAVQSL
jgi:dethiobiotin synthetase